MLLRMCFLLLLFVAKTVAADCSHPPSSSFSASGYSAYASWCRSCGGTPSNANGMSCTPGSDWGKAGGAGAGLTPQQQLEMGLIKMGADQLMEGLDMNGEKAKAERARRLQLQQQLERDRRAREEIEERELAVRHEEMAGQMKDMTAGNEIRLKDDSSAPILLKTDEPSGRPIINCSELKTKHDRMKRGLKTQEDFIVRAEKQIASAKASRAEANQQARSAFFEAALGESLSMAKTTLKKSSILKTRITQMRAQGTSTEDIKKWLVKMKLVDESAEKIEELSKLTGATLAGHNFGVQLQSANKTMGDRLWEANSFLVESGLAESVGEKLAETGAGPLGGLAFRAAKAAIEVGVAMGDGHLSDSEARVAQGQLDFMKEQLRRNQNTLLELHQDLKSYCR